MAEQLARATPPLTSEPDSILGDSTTGSTVVVRDSDSAGELLAKVENYVAELARGAAICDEPLAAAASAKNADFETKVHSWNPANPMWLRSNKE